MTSIISRLISPFPLPLLLCLQNFYLLFFPSPLEIPPTPFFLQESVSDFIALPSSRFLSLHLGFSSHYPVCCSALEPSPPHWASLWDAEGLSLSPRLLSLPACVLLAHKQRRLPVSTSLSLSSSPPNTALRCLPSSLFLPPTPSHCFNSLSLFPSPLPISLFSLFSALI